MVVACQLRLPPLLWTLILWTKLFALSAGHRPAQSGLVACCLMAGCPVGCWVLAQRYFNWYGSRFSQLINHLADFAGACFLAGDWGVLACVRVASLALAVWRWCINFCHEHL